MIRPKYSEHKCIEKNDAIYLFAACEFEGNSSLAREPPVIKRVKWTNRLLVHCTMIYDNLLLLLLLKSPSINLFQCDSRWHWPKTVYVLCEICFFIKKVFSFIKEFFFLHEKSFFLHKKSLFLQTERINFYRRFFKNPEVFRVIFF